MQQNAAHKKTREAFAETVIELAQSDPRIVFVSADCGAKEREYFRTEGRGRLIETGIAEDNSAVVAAGLAAEGFRPYILNFAYLLGRMYNQISQSICEDAYNVKLAAYYAGIWGTGGRSHNCVTDVGLMRTLPNLSIFAPADYWETKAVIRHLDVLDGPTYVRLAGVPTPLVYEREPDFQPLRRLSEGDHCTIFCHGTSVYEALQANRLGSLRAAVVDVAQLKPLPTADILCEARRTRRVVVVEEHSVIGGLGEAIASLLVQHDPMPMRVLGVRDQFALSVLTEGQDPEEIYRFYGIAYDDIIRAARGLMEGQGRLVVEATFGEPAQ